MKTVMVFGTFDIVHAGHLDFFRQAKKFGDSLTVVIGRDVTVTRLKKKPPFHSEKERLLFLRHIDYVDEAILGDKSNVYRIILKRRPNIIALGYDQKFFVSELFPFIKKNKLHIKIVRLRPYSRRKTKTKNIRQFFGLV